MRKASRIKPFLQKLKRLWSNNSNLTFSELYLMIHDHPKIKSMFYSEENQIAEVILELNGKHLTKRNDDITEFTNMLYLTWTLFPDLRFGQMISFMRRMIPSENIENVSNEQWKNSMLNLMSKN